MRDLNAKKRQRNDDSDRSDEAADLRDFFESHFLPLQRPSQD
jgi:hypothetical protein